MKTKPFFLRDASLTAVAILGVFLLGNSAVYSRVGGQAGQVMADLTVARLSDRDADLLLRGYYEDLVGINRFNTELWEVYNKRPSDWPLIQETDAARLRSDFEAIELMPSISIDFHGARFSTNSWGMRDQEYDLIPAPGTYRIALLGPSFVMGSGVADARTFEWLLEERLNAQNAGGDVDRFEILNFGVAGYAATQELYALENRALEFEPNAAYIVSHQLEVPVLIRNLASPFVEGEEIPYDFMRDVGERAGIEPGMAQGEVERRLQPYGEELTLKTYEHMVQVAAENNLRAVWIFMPTPEEAIDEAEVDRLHELAEAAGFTVVSLRDVYDGQDLDKLIVAEWDRHPNALGHQLIADLLYQRLLEAGALPTR